MSCASPWIERGGEGSSGESAEGRDRARSGENVKMNIYTYKYLKGCFFLNLHVLLFRTYKYKYKHIHTNTEFLYITLNI